MSLFQYPKTSGKTPTNDITYYKFEPAEWKYEMQGADQEFNEISNLLREELDKHSDDDDWFLDFQDKLYETCIEVLEKLKQESFFTQITGKEVFLTFTISDYEINSKYIRNLISRLNDNHYKAEFYQWMKSWEPTNQYRIFRIFWIVIKRLPNRTCTLCR